MPEFVGSHRYGDWEASGCIIPDAVRGLTLSDIYIYKYSNLNIYIYVYIYIYIYCAKPLSTCVLGIPGFLKGHVEQRTMGAGLTSWTMSHGFLRLTSSIP